MRLTGPTSPSEQQAEDATGSRYPHRRTHLKDGARQLGEGQHQAGENLLLPRHATAGCRRLLLIPIFKNSWTSLVVQWLKIHLSMQGTRVRVLVREDPTRRGAAKPVRHNY